MIRRDAVVDAAIAVAFVGGGVGLAVGLDLSTWRLVVAAVLVVAHAGPLVVRRRWPVGVLAAMVATGLLTPLAGIPVIVLGPAALVAVYGVAAWREPPTSTIACAAAVVGMAGAVLLSDMDLATVLTNGIAFAVVWWLGDRNRRAVDAAAASARRAVADERLRIARELHDVVAHSMSVIAVQAGSGRLVIDDAPDVARQALATIEATSRGALQEMRRLLAVLRDDGADPSELTPAPGLADVPALVAASVGAGLEVDVTTEGEPVPLPAGVDLCAFRIVQEALTNVRRHARSTRAQVSVRYLPLELEVEVVDDGPARAGRHSAPGHGLVGLRERTALYGGDFEAGPADRGFRVRARLPLAEPA